MKIYAIIYQFLRYYRFFCGFCFHSFCIHPPPSPILGQQMGICQVLVSTETFERNASNYLGFSKKLWCQQPKKRIDIPLLLLQSILKLYLMICSPLLVFCTNNWSTNLSFWLRLSPMAISATSDYRSDPNIPQYPPTNFSLSKNY